MPSSLRIVTIPSCNDSGRQPSWCPNNDLRSSGSDSYRDSSSGSDRTAVRRQIRPLRSHASMSDQSRSPAPRYESRQPLSTLHCLSRQEAPAAVLEGRRHWQVVNLPGCRPCFPPSSTPSLVFSSRPSIAVGMTPSSGLSSWFTGTSWAASSARSSGHAGGRGKTRPFLDGDMHRGRSLRSNVARRRGHAALLRCRRAALRS